MPRDPEPDRAFAQFLELWPKVLAAGAEPGTVVVVEGERDRASLRRLGWQGPVALVHRGQRLSGIAQALVRGHRRIIVLTDWDTEGGHLAHRLREFLEAEPVELDLDARRRLARVLRGELVHVEGLHRWARRNADRIGLPLEALLDVLPDVPPRPTG